MKPLNLELLVKSGAMAYPVSAFVTYPEKAEKLPPRNKHRPYTDKERAIAITIGQQKTREQILKELGFYEIWAKQKTLKQIAAEFGVTYRDVFNIYYSRKNALPHE